MDIAMIADLLLDTELADDVGADQPDYALRHPLQIAVCLRKLVAGHDFITVEFGGRQLVTQLLDVDSSNARFVFDLGSVAADNQMLLSASHLIFRGLPDGVRTEFATRSAVSIKFEGRLAFEARFPAVLYHVQRREFFRVDTPMSDPYSASGKLPNGSAFRVDVKDLSLGGIALRTTDASMGEMEAGTRLTDATLHLGPFGTLRLSMEVTSPRQSIMPNGERQFVVGCRFVDLPGTAERSLQRVVTYLEARCLMLAPR
jgi:flagellar brake protein